MMAMVETSAQQAVETSVQQVVETSVQQATTANKALEESRVELTAKIAELQQENQYLKDAQRKIQYDPCNPDI